MKLFTVEQREQLLANGKANHKRQEEGLDPIDFKPVVKEVEKPKSEKELKEDNEALKNHATFLDAEIVKKDAAAKELRDEYESLKARAASLEGGALSPEDAVVAAVMHVNAAIDGSFVASSGKNMGAFKAVGSAKDVGVYYRLDEYEAYTWIAHDRFPVLDGQPHR